jgi:branched-subunit amino acid ABC-type transport system permease component
VNQWALTIEFGIIDAFVIGIACMGFSMQFGITNYVNFAYGSFITFGAYMAYEADSALHLDLALAVLFAALTTGIASFVIGRFVFGPFLKRRPHVLYSLVLTFAAALVLLGLFDAIWGTDFKVLSYRLPTVHVLGPFIVTDAEILFVGLGLVCVLGVHILLRFTRLGRSMRAMSDDITLAQTCGLNVRRITDIAWGLTGALAGVAGVIEALQARAFTTNIGSTFIYLVFAAAVVGGIGRIYGALIGALILGLATQIAVPVVGSSLSPAIVFAVLVVVMIVRPTGILGPTGRSGFGQT